MNRRFVVVVCGLILTAGAVLFFSWFFGAQKTAETRSQIESPSPATETEKSGGSEPKLIVQYDSPPPHIAPVIPDPTPVPAQAVVKHGDKPYSPKFYSGHSERLAVALNETVPVEISWPEDKTHQDVFVQAVHGGKIDNGGNAKRFSLASSKTIAFTFTPDLGTGTYEIVLRRGTTEEALSFWVPTGDPHDVPAVKW